MIIKRRKAHKINVDKESIIFIGEQAGKIVKELGCIHIALSDEEKESIKNSIKQ